MESEYSGRKPDGKADHRGSHPKPSPTDLLSSAKVIAGAAKAAAGRDMDKVDKAKVASAAEDVLIAARHYGKLEEKSFGKYVQKAENYLHEYHSSRPGTGAGSGHEASSGGGGGPEHAPSSGAQKPSVAHPTGAHHGQSEEGGSGFGDYMKLAQGFLKKPGHEGGSQEGSGYGDYLKLAQDLLKKH
ncbi:nodulin-related protein 2-like [Nymphaea colorata]|nr:nodulin-related protein 2-like [Nymphaea colorata]